MITQSVLRKPKDRESNIFMNIYRCVFRQYHIDLPFGCYQRILFTEDNQTDEYFVKKRLLSLTQNIQAQVYLEGVDV